MQIFDKIAEIADNQIRCMNHRLAQRLLEMKSERTDHYDIFAALGVFSSEARLMEEQEQRARFVYANAGKFADKSVKLCFTTAFPDAKTVKIPNPFGEKPKTFEIDVGLPNGDGVEIKWRDATTDGDHRNKEKARVKAVAMAGYKPVRLMLFDPNRDKAIKAQAELRAIYTEIGGEYLSGTEAFDFIEKRTGVDYSAILKALGQRQSVRGSLGGIAAAL